MRFHGCKAWFLVLLGACLATAPAFAKGGKEESAGPMTISWISRIASSEGRSWSLETINEKFGVNIVPYGADTYDRDKINMMLAAGEFPDCGEVPEDPAKLYKEGIIRKIPENLIRKDAPGYAKHLDNELPLGWLMNKAPDAKGAYLSLSGISTTTDVACEVVCVRADWAKNVGMPLPNYDAKKTRLDRFGRVYYLDEPITLEWLERLLVALRDGDPDGNGKADTIPWGGSNEIKLTWSPIMGAFGVGQDCNTQQDGRLYEWNTAPGYKNFLKLAARWYKERLLDREFLNLTKAKGWEKTEAGLVAAATGQHGWAGRYEFVKRPPNSLASDAAVAKGAEVAVFLPVGPDGRQGSPSARPVGAFSGDFTIGKKVDDGKLEKILQIVDYMRYSEVEGWIYAKEGKPGVHFDWEGEAWKSMPIRRDFKAVPEGYPDQGYFPTVYPPGYTKDRFPFLLPKDLAAFWESFQFSPRGQALVVRPYRYDLFSETGYGALRVKYGDTLDTITKEFFFKSITGEVDVDAGWDAYVEKWMSNGGSQVLAESAKAPLVADLIQGKVKY